MTDVDLRRQVRDRDGGRCRFCGTTENLHVHHVRYRSQGGPDDEHNLITLCVTHHDLVHSDKRTYQPLCEAYLNVLYGTGRILTLPQIARWGASLQTDR